jgi:hypothetical protein
MMMPRTVFGTRACFNDRKGRKTMKGKIAYVAGGKRFATLKAAKAYAERIFKEKGIILGIEAVVYAAR